MNIISEEESLSMKTHISDLYAYFQKVLKALGHYKVGYTSEDAEEVYIYIYIYIYILFLFLLCLYLSLYIDQKHFCQTSIVF
jgi:hypothetical protein